MLLDRREEMNDNQSNNDGVGTQARRRGALHVFVRIHYWLMCVFATGKIHLFCADKQAGDLVSLDDMNAAGFSFVLLIVLNTRTPSRQQ